MTALRLGIVGAGAVGELHVQAAGALPDRFTVAAVVDPTAEAAERLARPAGAVTYGDHADLIASGAVDAVVVGSPHAAHCRQVVDFVSAGIPTLVEKPMAISVDECETMIAAAREHRVPFGVGHIQRQLPTVRAAQRLLDEGAIGKPHLVVDRRGGRYEPGTRPQWFLDPRHGRGGILTNLGSHCVDKLFQLTGQDRLQVRTAWADGVDVITDLATMVEMDGGVVASITLVGNGLPTSDVTEVVGDDGALHIDRARGVTVYRRGEVVHQEPSPREDIPSAFVRQLEQFHDAVVAGTDPAFDGAYGLKVFSALEQIAAASSRTGPT